MNSPNEDAIVEGVTDAGGAIADAVQGAAQVAELTPDAALVEKAAKALAHLFEIMGIKRVISVDDSYEGEIDDLLAMADFAATAGTTEFLGRFDLSQEEEIWRGELTDAWEEAEVTERRLLLAGAHKESGDQDIDEPQLDVSHLQPLLAPSGVEFEAVAPDDWPGMLSDVVMDAQERPTLVLLDQQMGDKGDEGIRFAEKLFKEDAHQSLYVALLTRKVDKGEENQRWAELVAANEKLKAERFVVISKEHLGPNPKTFPDAIKIVLMAKPAATLRAAVATAVGEATSRASKDLDGLSPDDFQKMIVKSSIHEGIWEAESLLRVFQLMMRSHIRAELYGKQVVKDSASQIRRLWMLDEREPSTSSAARELARAEHYDDPLFVNEVHLPVELGDLFSANDKLYVVVEQPCDLMVRKNGTRTPDLNDVTLLQVQLTRPSPLQDGFELPFHQDHGKPSWVHFKRSISVPVSALDYTVFASSGASRLNLAEDQPSGLWPAWEARYRLLKAKAQTLKQQFQVLDDLRSGNRLSKDLHNALTKRLLQTDSTSGRSVKGSLDGDEVRYEIARVGRIRRPLADNLLLQYSLHRARDAQDYPLAAAVGG